MPWAVAALGGCWWRGFSVRFGGCASAAALAAEEDARKAKEAAVLPIEIFVAGMTGDSEVVFDWLDRGGDINAGEEMTQATLLMAAAAGGPSPAASSSAPASPRPRASPRRAP